MTFQDSSASAASPTAPVAARCRVGIDIGGTFTDFVLEAGARRFTHKVLTTQPAPEQGVLDGLGVLLARAGVAPTALDAVLHGTTLATNALLERRGARTALLTTDGFRDVIETGTESRCDQYDLTLGKGAPLIERAWRFAVPERVGAQGQVLLPLDTDAVVRHARRIGELGIQSLAIGFMHSYANPAHERLAADIVARYAPHVDVSLSSDVSPEIREFERFSTTCVNAYVQPLMRAYLERLHAGLEALGVRAPLLLMLSNGGLCDVATACRYPVRLLESGPAGGALLAAELARRHGFDSVLSLDIGGTTAKLCFIDHGEPQTARSLEVARHYRFKPGSGIPLRIPVIELAEIGAGGGSIARVDQLGRVAVGPDSAGSSPGPACYGRGGEAATLTDAHLHAGRLDPRYFAAGTLPLDAVAAERVVAEQIGDPLGVAADEAAYAVAEVADEAMAQAAREHAVETGRSVAGRVLIAFGGSAPLHAARLADKLAVDRVLIPAQAGVGSALGFLHAPLAFEASQSLYQRLDALDVGRVGTVLDALAARATAVLAGLAPNAPRVLTRHAFLRYAGQGHELRVAVPQPLLGHEAATQLADAFAVAYRERYGLTIADAPVEALGWTVRVVVDEGMQRPPLASWALGPRAGPDGNGPDGRERGAPVAELRRAVLDQSTRARAEHRIVGRAALADGAVIDGPAVLLDDETTIVVPSAFDARVLDGGDLLLSRRARPAGDVSHGADGAVPGSADLDAIGLQIVWNRLIATVEEQARLLMRTAFSPTVREAGDLSAGVFDARGRLIAQAVTGTPGHVNSMAEAVHHFLVRFPLDTLSDGDHFITNDPWLSSGHLHDVTVVSPVFADGRPIAFFACTCHQVDIGGLGQGPDGRSVYEEGLFIPIMRLMRAGTVNQDLLDIVRANVRQPEQVVGDLMSYVTANSVSGKRLAATLGEYGISDFQALAGAIIERSRVVTREAIRALPDGVHRYAMQIDGYDTPVDLCATLRIEGERLRVDFDGSSPASPRGINLVLNYTRAYSAFALRAALAPHVPNNAGSLAPFEIDAPLGSILNVEHPWPVSARHIIGQFLPDVVFGCLAGVLPDVVPAEGASCVWGAQLRGGPQVSALAGLPTLTTEPFETLFFNSGGSGARPGADGLSATAFPSGIKAISCEVIEAGNPIVIWRKELLPGSGGAGRWRGGAGQRIEIGTRNGAPFQFFGMYDRVQRPARGRAGGGDGAPGWVGLTDGTRLAAMGLQTVPAHARLRLDVPGGGGYGAPKPDRDDDA